MNPDSSKIDFIRVINAMCELRMFTTSQGLIADKKEVFQTFGVALNQDFSGFHKNLGQGKGTSSRNENRATEATFDKLKEAAVKFNEKKMNEI